MLFSKLKFLASFALAIALLGGGAGAIAYRAALAETSQSPAEDSASFGAPAAQVLPADTGQDSAPSADKLASAPGWRWLLSPRKPKSTEWSHGGVVCLVDADKEGAPLVYLAYQGNFDPAHEQYRPVLFDAAGQRYLLKAERGGRSSQRGRGQITMLCYRLDPKTLSHEKVAYVGVEANQGGGK